MKQCVVDMAAVATSFIEDGLIGLCLPMWFKLSVCPYIGDFGGRTTADCDSNLHVTFAYIIIVT